MEKIVVSMKDGKYTVKIGEGKPVDVVPNADRYIKLPSNSLNRVWVSCDKVDKADKQTLVIDTAATAKKTGPRNATPKNYTEADKTALAKIDEQIKALQEKRRQITAKYAAKKPTKTDEMYAALAKKFNTTVEEIKKTALDAKKVKKA